MRTTITLDDELLAKAHELTDDEGVAQHLALRKHLREFGLRRA